MAQVTVTVLVIVIVVSMIVAVIIKGLTALLGRQRAVAPAAAPAVPAVAPTPAAPTTAGGHTPEHIAAITAAVAAVFDEAAVIVHIEPSRGSEWTHESRAAHHTSHNLGRGSR